jgi:hypothetical protein
MPELSAMSPEFLKLGEFGDDGVIQIFVLQSGRRLSFLSNVHALALA